MPTFVSQRLWPAVVAVGVLGIGGFVYAAIGYVERTSDAAFAEFLVATASPTSNPVTLERLHLPLSGPNRAERVAQ
jgi:hypothetical protein